MLQNSPRDTRVIRTREKIFLIPRFLSLFIKTKNSLNLKPHVFNENEPVPITNIRFFYPENRSYWSFESFSSYFVWMDWPALKNT